MMDYIFEFATRNKLRFPYKGLVSVEDLWDLNQTQLDSIYRSLMKEKKDKEKYSLITTQSTTNKTMELDIKIDIVHHIFNVKEEEMKVRENYAKRAEQKQKILDILAKKQDDSLNNMSEEELLKMLENL